MDTDDIRNYLSFYQNENKCTNLTIDGVRRTLSSFFAFLEIEEYIVKSPVRRIHKIKTDILVKETYSDEILERLRNNCNHIRNLAIIDLLASSGIRISELVNLNIEDQKCYTSYIIVYCANNNFACTIKYSRNFLCPIPLKMHRIIFADIICNRISDLSFHNV